MSELKFYLFGPSQLERGGVPLKLGRRKAMALLAYVALMRQSHSREALATLLWPEYDRRRGRTDLSRTLSVLNKALEPGWLVIERRP